MTADTYQTEMIFLAVPIILVSSAMHYVGLANHSPYAVTRAALRSYSRTWAAEFKDIASARTR